MAPAIIERHSLAAYALPSFEIANARVASATEGAAPNNPPKLVGLKRPPTIAKAETTSPPMRKRTTASLKAAAALRQWPAESFEGGATVACVRLASTKTVGSGLHWLFHILGCGIDGFCSGLP